MSALRGMVSFFTMIRLDITKDDMDDMDRQFHLVPLVGLIYGILAVTVMFTVTYLTNLLIAAVATMFVIQLMNRFLHIDGTIDVGDGLTVAGGRDDHLRALKDTRIGAGGMAFALFVTILTVAELASVDWLMIALIPLTAEVLSKNSMVSAAAFGTPGEGMAGNSVRNTTAASMVKSLILSSLLVFAYYAAISLAGWDILYWDAALAIVLAIAVSVFIGALMARIAERNFGMVNGDVLGATNEISRMAVMFVMIAVITVI